MVRLVRVKLKKGPDTADRGPGHKYEWGPGMLYTWFIVLWTRPELWLGQPYKPESDVIAYSLRYRW